MKLSSINVRGLGGWARLLALKRLMEIEKPDILLLQETMSIEMEVVS